MRASRPAIVAVITAAALGFSAVSTVAAASAPKAQLVALGDSVPRGTNCNCTPYPALSADGLSTRRRAVSSTNDSVAGYTTKNVLHQLDTDQNVIDHLRHAEVIEIEIGANDVPHSAACGTNVDCYAPRIPQIETNLGSIVRHVHQLTAGHKALVVLLDYWSVWLGGKYAAAKGQAYVNAAEEVTDQVNAAIKRTAKATGSAYVDLRAAFKGRSYSFDETRYLSNDGDHPNAAGHRRIATATERVVQRVLHL